MPEKRASERVESQTRCFVVMMIGLIGMPSAAAERIANDSGGRIEEYVARCETPEAVVIDGSLPQA